MPFRFRVAPLALLGLASATLVAFNPAVASASATTAPYTPSTPQLATITNGTAAAPWNEWQGDPAAASYSSNGVGTVLPTYTTGGTTIGGSPNVSVMPGSTSGTDGNSPYPSGTVGSPGPLAGYCGTGNQTTESAGAPARQPAGSTLPLAPAYFPHIVKNADGSLTGYFDYRPKDADEAVEVAKSTDGGKSWVYEGEALEQNTGYCPSGDVNDDGNGHPYVLTVGGVTRIYTLQRAAGDQQGVGMLVHALNPTASNPLNGAPASESVGIDPDGFATSAVSVTNGTPSTIPLTTTGTSGSTEQLVAGGFVDLTRTPTPTAASVITCTAVSANSLTGCTTTSGNSVSVGSGDLIEQVIGYVKTAATVPAGPNASTGDSGLASISVATTSAATTTGFTNSLTGTTYNNNAPNRAYINGVAVYCTQANANPTTKMEDCTTGPTGSALSAAVGSPITSDPIIPASATAMTSGLVAPDGIVGVLPSYPGAPAGSTIVMYTEKELGYYVAGTTTNSSSTAFGSTLTFNPSAYESQDMPATVSASQPVTVSVGDTTQGTIVSVTCTGLTTGTTDSLTGCGTPTGGNYASGDKYAATSWIGAPGATTVSSATLAQTGEGSTSAAKLLKNNEDLAVVRVAYTTDGVNFSTSGLDNGGVISGQSNGASSYTDLSNPSNTTSPANLNAYATPGTQDAIELRWAGSAGSIITNPDGSYGLFLSGSWAADGDSDAYNQIFYSSSTDGEHWSIPTTVVSTDYTFAASIAQDQAVASGTNAPLGISAYYSGRAYGPSVVQNADGSLTMLFAGYRLPKTIAAVGTTVGTGSTQYTVGATDPTAYRNILVETLAGPPTTASVSGTITAPGGAVDPNACAYLYQVGNSTSATAGTCTQSDGTYAFANVAAGSYDLAFADPTGSYATQWYNGTASGAASQASASTVTVTAGNNVTGLNATFVAVPQVGTLTGTVKSATTGSPVSDACVYLYQPGNSTSSSYATCATANGSYEIDNVVAGSYDVAYFDPAGTYATQWYTGSAGGSATQGGATAVTIANGATTSGINASMRAVNQSGNLTGTVTEATGGAPVSGECVYLYQPGNSSGASYATCTQSDGTYGVYGAATGSYDVAFADPTGAHVTQWYSGSAGGAASQSTAVAVGVPDAGQTTSGIDAAVVTVGTGSISGTVTASGAPVGNVCVYLYQPGNSAGASYATCTQADGTYTIGGVAAGQYDVAFYDPTGTYATQWSTGSAGGSSTQSGATAVTVQNGGRTTAGVDAAMVSAHG